MDFVESERLDRAWPKMSLLAKARTAWTLRSYVRQLRRIPIPEMNVPGPLGPQPRRCQGLLFGRNYEAGPFRDREELAAYLNAIALSARTRYQANGHRSWHFRYENDPTGRMVFYAR